MDLAIVGTMALDTVETPFGNVKDALGGSGSYAGCAASFFARPGLVGVVGEDFPDEHLAALRSRGIDTSGVERAPGGTFRWGGRYETDVNVRATLFTELNALEKFDPKLPDDYKKTKYLFLANIEPGLQNKVLDQCGSLEFTILDTMNFWIEGYRAELDRALKRVDAVMLNDEEARMLTGRGNLRAAAAAALEMGPRIVVVKKGEHGAMMFTKSSHFALPGYPLETLKDPTGAGDSFAGGFIGYVASRGSADEETLRQAMVAGTATASYCCEDFSIDRFRTLNISDVAARAASVGEAVRFSPLEWK